AVCRTERVELAFAALREARKAATLAQGANTVAAAGQDLVRVGLVSDVPDQDVARGVEHVVQRHRELDHAEPCAQVPTGDRYRVDGLLAQLVRKLPQLGSRELPQVGRDDHLIQEWRLAVHALTLPAAGVPASMIARI